MQAEIGRAVDDHVLTVEADEWADALAERYSIEVPEFDLANRWMDEAEDIQFVVSHQGFTRPLPPGGGPFNVGGTRHVVHVPFSGGSEVFFLKPSSFTFNPPHAAISGSDLLLTWSTRTTHRRTSQRRSMALLPRCSSGSAWQPRRQRP